MGTRNLTAVYFENEYRIAQYGQWDGYPEGQGMTALKFARRIATNSDLMNQFKSNLKQCRWADDAYLKEIELWHKAHPHETLDMPALSRDTGAEILDNVLKLPRVLVNKIDFAADSLFCEYAYVIDLDKNTFEAYKGFNKQYELTEEDRFYFLRDKEDDGRETHYYGIRLVEQWDLDDLPSDEDFLKAFCYESDAD